MALIKCPECSKEVSDKAANCIHCGYPIGDMLKKEEKKMICILNGEEVDLHELVEYGTSTVKELRNPFAVLDILVTEYDMCWEDANTLATMISENKLPLKFDYKTITELKSIGNDDTLKNLKELYSISPSQEKIIVPATKRLRADGVEYNLENLKKYVQEEQDKYKIKCRINGKEWDFDGVISDIKQYGSNPNKLYELSKNISAKTGLTINESVNLVRIIIDNNFVPPKEYNSMQENNIPRCPKCGSTQIQMVNRKFSLLTGFATNKVDRVCVNCKYKW